MRKKLCYNNLKYDKELIIMTKSDIEWVIKRYRHIKNLIKNNQTEIFYYVGKRRQHIRLTEEIKSLYDTTQEVYLHIKEGWIKKLIEGILKGKSDVFLLQLYPCGRSLYYTIKKEFVEAVYRCCIAKQMIGYEELLEIGIAR